MKRKIILPLDLVCTIERLCDEYEDAYHVSIPDDVFFEMIINTAVSCMQEVIKSRADFSKMEEIKNEN